MYQIVDDTVDGVIKVEDTSSDKPSTSSFQYDIISSQDDVISFPLDSNNIVTLDNEGNKVPDTSFRELLDEPPRNTASSSASSEAGHNIVDNLMDSHIRSEPHPSPVVPTVFICELCGKTFTQNWILNKHYTTAHGYSGGRMKICKCGKTVDTNSKHICHDCPYCVLKFPSKLALRDHILNQHTQTSKKCEICSETFTSQQMYTKHVIECRVKKGPLVTDKNQQIICDKCNGTLTSYQQFQKHETNYNLLSHMCPVCNARFCLISNTFRHVWQEHHRITRGSSEYVCPLCPDARFVNFRLYAYHIMDTHETSPLVQEGKVKVRISMLNSNRRLKDKLLIEEQQEAWDYEGEYHPEEEVEQNDYTRASSRIEKKYSMESCPTMLAKKRKEDLVSLPPLKRKVRQKKNVVLNCKDKVHVD